MRTFWHRHARLLTAGLLGAITGLPAGQAMQSQLGPHPQSVIAAWLPATIASAALLAIVFVVSAALDWRQQRSRHTAVRAVVGLGILAVELGVAGTIFVLSDRLPEDSPILLVVALLGHGFGVPLAFGGCALSTAIVFALTPPRPTLPHPPRAASLTLGAAVCLGATLGAWFCIVLALFISFLPDPTTPLSDKILVVGLMGVFGLFAAAMLSAYTFPGFLLGALIGARLRSNA